VGPFGVTLLKVYGYTKGSITMKSLMTRYPPSGDKSRAIRVPKKGMRNSVREGGDMCDS